MMVIAEHIFIFSVLCLCMCAVNDSCELTSGTTRSISATNNSYSMSSNSHEDERLLNIYLY